MTAAFFASALDFGRKLAALPVADRAAREHAAARQATLTKPPGSLGRLEEIAVFLAGWQRGGVPAAGRIQAIVFAGNHGVVRQGVSPYPAAVTGQMVVNFQRGGAAINALATEFALELVVQPLALDNPTGDITEGPALTETETLAALNAGAMAVDPSSDVALFGEMGIGNTTIAAVLAAAAFGGTGAEWAGPGTGLDAGGIARKAAVIDRALARHGQGGTSPFALLQSLGGRELCAIAGGVVAARHHRIPVILDGFVATAALAPLVRAVPAILEHCLAGHRSAEPGHRRLLSLFGLEPLLALDMRLGEGTGAALASAVVRAAVATHRRMATFAEAGVANSHGEA